MIKTRIIPCLDVDNGRVVKGINFVDLKDAGDPVKQAKFYSDNGADEITFLDITATHQKRKAMVDIIERTANECLVPLTVGGGIKSIEDMNMFLSVGADKVSVNSSAINNPSLISKGADKFGNQCIVVAIDAKKTKKSWDVFINGGRINTGLDVIQWAKKVESLGAGEILLTSMDRDGTKIGFDLDLTRNISDHVGIPVIASGGVGEIGHFVDGVKVGGASALLAASVFHFGKFTITEVKKHLISQGIDVRIDY
ncbi:MAG: imidazole glycerol phosphate synthase subunit HisF [Rickettsiales bacterium]|nr:imidazole glycerol phosphate synthase subunit HisF [Rickettsiales bacterium]